MVSRELRVIVINMNYKKTAIATNQQQLIKYKCTTNQN
jgi:hypothetical protein